MGTEGLNNNPPVPITHPEPLLLLINRRINILEIFIPVMPVFIAKVL